MNAVRKNDRTRRGRPPGNLYESPDDFLLKLKPYLQYHLFFLKPLLPHALYKHMVSRSILTINDFYEMDLAQLLNSEELNNQQVVQLKSLKRSFEKCNPRIINVIKAHKMETYLPISKYKDTAVLSGDILSALKQVLYSFLYIKNDKRLKTVITMRFGIGSHTATTLDEIGASFGLTREWARLTKNRCLADLAVVLDGALLKKPFCRCDQDYVECFSTFKSLYIPEFIIEKQKVFSRLTEKAVNRDSRIQKALFELLLEVWNAKTILFEKKDYLINPAIPESLFSKTATIIKNFLIEKAIPCSKSEIARAVMKETDNEASHDLIYALLEIIPDVKFKNDNRYEIDHCLIPKEAVTEQIYRILFDKQECMYYKNILKELRSRYAHSRNKFEGGIATMVLKMKGDSRFVSIGRTGNWGLAEWNLNCSNITGLIVQYLRTRKKPATVDEITRAVQRIRPHIKKVNIYALLNYNQNKLARIHDGKCILKAWKSSYNTNYTGPAGSGLNLYTTIMNIFRENNFKPLYAKELHMALTKNNIRWTLHNAYARFRQCPYLKRKIVDHQSLISFDRKMKPPVAKQVRP